MFRNMLVQKLWKTFAQTQVFKLYLQTIRDKYGEQQYNKFILERDRILEETDFDIC